MKLIAELRRRNVIRMAAIYAVAAWLMLQFAEVLAGLTEFPEWLGPAVIIALAIGFPIALLFSWFYELTPEGITTDIGDSAGNPIIAFTGRMVDFAVIAFLSAAIILFAYDKWWVAARHGDSIAVLPFTNMSSEVDTEYFSDGISEELLNVLSKLPGLRVAARTSSFHFKDKDVPAPEFASALNVAYILEGSVRKVGNQVRITAQLVDGRDGYHIWSDTYDRDLGDIFEIQDEIAARISDSLQLSLGKTAARPAQKASTNVNADAYELYLEGQELVHRRDGDSVRQAILLFDRSLRLDPNFAPAHAWLAIATLLQVQVGYIHTEDAWQIAAPKLERARELDPELPEYYGGMALMSFQQLDRVAAMEYALAALERRPNYSDAMNWLELAYDSLGRYHDSDRVLEELLAADPMNIVGRMNYIQRLNFLGRHEEAHEHADILMTIDKAAGMTMHSNTSLKYEGDISEGLRWELLAGKERGMQVRQNISAAFLSIGEIDEARRYGESPEFLLSKGRGEKLVETLLGQVERDQRNIWVELSYGFFLFEAGYVEEARQLIKPIYEQNPDKVRSTLEPVEMVELAWLKREAGDHETAMELVELAREDLAGRIAAGRQHKGIYLGMAALAAFEGDREECLHALRAAIERGLLDRRLFHNPMIQSLRDDPGLLELQAELDAILAREHRQVLELICLNNPVPDDWRPLPETCDDFRA